MDKNDKLQMVIFDLDGTIIDDEAAYKKAFAKVLSDLGVKKDFELIGSAGVAPNWDYLIDKFDIKTKKTPDELAILTQAEYLKHLNEIEVRGGFFELIEDLKNNQILVALATSNNFSIVDEVLQKFHLEGIFDTITTLEEVKFAKPDPDLFLEAARKEDIEPQNCMVIEDAAAGVKAAHAANMKVVCINDIEGADLTISSFDELSFNKLNKLYEETRDIN